MHPVFLRLLILACCLFLLEACARQPSAPQVQQPGEVADLRTIPQDLTAFLDSSSEKPLLDSAARDDQYERYRTRFFAPWDMSKPSIKKKDVAPMLKRKARGWKGTAAWGESEWRSIANNGDIDTYPNLSAHGITLRATDLREMPTHSPRFTEPTSDVEANPFDYFQYSTLHAGMPVFLCHRSKNGKWYYVETALAAGWVDARDIGTTTPVFEALYRAAPLGAVVQENVTLAEGVRADIGAVLPLSESGSVLLPVKADGVTQLEEITPPEGSVVPMPMTMTPLAVAELGNSMLGQKYGWGGMLGLRDCSSTTRDLMTPFGIWLPRNSRAQGKTGNPFDMKDMEVQSKERLVLRQGVPFASLVVMRGHVTLFVGKYRGRPVIMHNIWGIRTNGPKGDDRLVIGRNVVTTMTPGAELPNLADGKTIGDRFHTVTVLGGAHTN